MSSPAPPAARGPTRLQRVIVWTALFAVPLVWVLYLFVSVKLVAAVCSGGISQRNALSWGATEWVVTAASGLGFVVCLSLTLAAGRAWRQIISLVPKRGDAIRFVAWCSVTMAAAFTFALVFTASVLLVLPIDRLCTPFQ